MKVGVVHFPGSTGLKDTVHAFQNLLMQEVQVIPHTAEEVRDVDLLVIPGGASYGDYLRPGGIAKTCRVSGSIRRFARDGKPVLGICNGFQILCEMELLPGAFLMNSTTRFKGEDTWLKVESQKGHFGKGLTPGELLKLPMASRYGAFYADYRTVKDLEEQNHILLRYCDAEGELDLEGNYNGSVNSIAGIMNRQENVVGIMPHPERAMEEIFGDTDGLKLLRAFL